MQRLIKIRGIINILMYIPVYINVYDDIIWPDDHKY